MKYTILSCIAASIIFASCSSETPPQETQTSPVVNNDTAPVNEITDFKFRMVIGNIPSPFETIHEISQTEMKLNKSILNKPENESKYLTSGKKALNYGIYGVDLAYLAATKEFSEVPKYLKTTRNLAVSLNAASSFDRVVSSRLESNMENKDTITRLMDEAFAATDEYLRSSERQLAATQMLTGSWVESRYITLHALKDREKNVQNEFLFQKVFEQKQHLGYLMDLLKEYENEAELKPVIKKLEAMNNNLKKIKTPEEINSEKINSLLTDITAVREVIIE